MSSVIVFFDFQFKFEIELAFFKWSGIRISLFTAFLFHNSYFYIYDF